MIIAFVVELTHLAVDSAEYRAEFGTKTIYVPLTPKGSLNRCIGWQSLELTVSGIDL